MKIDIIDEGSIVLFVPRDGAALEWLLDNTVSEPWQWLGDALAVDHRCADRIVEALGAAS